MTSPGSCAPRAGARTCPRTRAGTSGFGVCVVPVASFDPCLVDFWSWDFPLSLLYFRAEHGRDFFQMTLCQVIDKDLSVD